MSEVYALAVVIQPFTEESIDDHISSCDIKSDMKNHPLNTHNQFTSHKAACVEVLDGYAIMFPQLLTKILMPFLTVHEKKQYFCYIFICQTIRT